jgi:hypothetical protein
VLFSVFNSKEDDALIALCGFDFASFQTMHSQFKVLFDNLSPYHSHGQLIAKHNKKKGGRHLITLYQCLALVLAWTRTQGSFAALKIIFGMTAGCLSLWLRFGQRLLIQILHNDEHSRPSMPMDNEIAGFVSAISTKYPALTNCWGAIDGLKLWLQRSGYNKIQNLIFNSWTTATMCVTFFCFLLMGKYGHAL